MLAHIATEATVTPNTAPSLPKRRVPAKCFIFTMFQVAEIYAVAGENNPKVLPAVLLAPA